jgi:hypothetical protein
VIEIFLAFSDSKQRKTFNLLIKLKGERHAESNNHKEGREENHHEENCGKEEYCEKNYKKKQVKDLLLTCRRCCSEMHFF